MPRLIYLRCAKPRRSYQALQDPTGLASWFLIVSVGIRFLQLQHRLAPGYVAKNDVSIGSHCRPTSPASLAIAAAAALGAAWVTLTDDGQTFAKSIKSIFGSLASHVAQIPGGMRGAIKDGDTEKAMKLLRLGIEREVVRITALIEELKSAFKKLLDV